ncbi:hypothetical protein NQZ68_021937 [Dissostichus eleginoides]|nr:hypothetical protein NQZ68_021937 [Dissostichus eleginoides]
MKGTSIKNVKPPAVPALLCQLSVPLSHHNVSTHLECTISLPPSAGAVVEQQLMDIQV